MECSSHVRFSDRIITAHNSDKKLSFQGWEKCVEAFSQGKDQLSYRCLSQVESSQIDQEITWSSSDEDSEQSSSHMRSRPSRTLLSFINFGDCKRVQRRGRRHSSALFIRSIEKQRRGIDSHSVAETQALYHPSQNLEEESEAMVVNDGPAHTQESSQFATENSDETVWEKNLSILNDRINVSTFSDSLAATADKLEEGVKTTNDEGTLSASPILKPLKTKRKKRKISNKPQVDVGGEENGKKSSIFQVEPSSPILGSGGKRKRPVRKVLQAPLLNSAEKSQVNCCDISKRESTCSPQSNLVGSSSPSSKGPLKKDERVSPIIGTSRRRAAPRMVVEESISPILGSKLQSNWTSKINRPTQPYLSLSRDEDEKPKKPSDVSQSEPTLNEPIVSLTQNTAKRSLDFSQESSRLTEIMKYDGRKSLLTSNNANNSKVKTDQMVLKNIAQVAPPPPCLQKKKRLSLNDTPLLKHCKKVPQMAASGKEIQAQHNLIVEANLKEPQCQEDACSYKRLTIKDRILDETHYIEEELSEPMSLASPDILVPLLSAKSKSSVIRSCENDSQNTHPTRKLNEDSFEIDSCSSQNPDEIQVTQIEKLPSSCLSSPLTISQQSSPVGPVVVCKEELGKTPDDFNAPPKKGMKKLKPDGLASRLQRLISRQRSSSRMWQFRRSKHIRARTSPTVNSDCGTSLLVVIDRTWTEYSHVMVQGHVQSDASRGNFLKFLDSPSNSIVVVLDPYIAEKLGKVMTASAIRIFPPWQGLKLRGISLILGAHCIEVPTVSPLVQVPLHMEDPEVVVPPDDGIGSTLEQKLCDILFAKVEDSQTCLFSCTDLSNELPNFDKTGTISALISSHYISGTSPESVKLTILRCFQYHELSCKDDVNILPQWSLLGQDGVQDLCEIVLGSKQSDPIRRKIWEDVESGNVIGRTYNFEGFIPVQRISPFSVCKLWRVVSNMNMLCSPDKHVFYVLSAGRLEWDCQLLQIERKVNELQPKLSSLSSVDREALGGPSRVHLICRLLHLSEDRMYVTDLETSPKVTLINLNPMAYVPPAISNASLIAIFDAEVIEGELQADKYSRIFDFHESFLATNLYGKEQYSSLTALNPHFPPLQAQTPAKTLALFSGTVIGVDEDSAYMWPACGICENELLSLGDNSERYRCTKCNDKCENFILRMSLQVICSSFTLPKTSSVRIKLLQTTIMSLLPSTSPTDEGYDVNAILGKKLGPMRCEVLTTKEGHFTLQELPAT